MGARQRLAGLVQDSSLYALLFLLPFSGAAVEISFGGLLLGWLLRHGGRTEAALSLWRQRSLRPLLWSVGAYLGVCALSVLVSTHPELSVRAWVSKWLEYLLLFLLAADLVWERPAVGRRAVWVVVASIPFVLVEAISQEVTGRGLFRGLSVDSYGRMRGPYTNPADLATYLMVVLPIALMVWRTLRGWRRWGLAIVLLVAAGCLVRTETLGAWIGLGVGGLVLVIVAPSVRRALIVIGAMASTGGIVYLLAVGRAQDILSLDEIGKTDRWVMWQAAVGMIRDRPILGQGLNTFMANYLDYWVGGERMPRYAHNCYLQVVAETGLAGLAAFSALLALWWRRCLRTVRAVGAMDAPAAAWLAGLMAGLSAFLVQAGLDTNFYSLRQAAIFWTLAGLALGMSERVRGDRASTA